MDHVGGFGTAFLSGHDVMDVKPSCACELGRATRTRSSESRPGGDAGVKVDYG